MNLGVKLYFKQKADQRQLTELEHKNLEQQLEYLKYQLNPHFLMNTLNNIHALVDIDGERAKEAIIQLSKILHYVLYETNNKRVSINKELEFMQNYTDLMRMRYGKKLQFTDTSCQLVTPGTDQPQMIPPLLFISFVENAFKHGVSYQQPSFIEITGKRYKDKQEHNRLLWSCRNSKHQKQQQTTVPQQGGVGMANVRQRLDIIFGNNYTLNVNETDNTYEVTLDIPMEA
jgi:LytS/YehU family sensor histidine kinase